LTTPLSTSYVFTHLHTDSATAARVGVLHTAHGDVPTPIFMPVGTQATVKAVPTELLRTEVNAPIILGNNYHLFLRPGSALMEQAGGLHKFMAWDRAMLSDSGGYQVYSLSHRRKITDDGVMFQSHIDGSRHLFTPENVVAMQRSLGTDVMMLLDECTPYPCDERYARKSLALTHRWAERGRRAFVDSPPLYGHHQLQFGIVQGSVYDNLRRESCHVISDLDFEGNAIGGLAVGEPKEQLYAYTELCCSLLPAHKPRYLMGVGTPANLLECIARGVDMFDCVMPSRNARHGLLFTAEGIRNIRNAKYKDDFSPIDPAGYCTYDTLYTKAYLRHLFVAEEFLALTIASVHNLAFYLWLVREARRRILDGTFADWKADLVPQLERRI